jgi:hypothetical protein
VERSQLGASKLYLRARAVFVVYGGRIDPKLNVPLFNKPARKKANNILKEILLGPHSDQPGFQLYHPQINAKGEPAKDKLGFQLIECDRGTKKFESGHRINRDTFVTRHTGIESSDSFSTERRHRHNQLALEKHRAGYPKVGHYDSWLVDQEQILTEENHNILLFPTWSNASCNYVNTSETFQTVPLHSSALDEAINSVQLPAAVSNAFSSDQKYLCEVMKTHIPTLPIRGQEGCKLFQAIMLENTGEPNEQTALEWTKNIDGIDLFPTTPFYLRMHHKKWTRNQRVKDSIKTCDKRTTFYNI